MRNRRPKGRSGKRRHDRPRPVRSSFLLFALSLVPALALLWLVGLPLFTPADSSQSRARLPTESAADVREVEHAIHLASNYLARQLVANGQFVYRINLNADVSVKRRYNILRHAGAIYALGTYHQRFPDSEIASSMSGAGDFLRSQIAPLPEHQEVLAVWSRPETNGRSGFQEAKLGGTGLGLVALLSEERIHPGATDRKTLQGLGEFLLFMQQPDGNYYSKYVPERGGFDDWVSLYYPGEAALGLVMLYEHDPEQKWLAGAKSAMEYLARIREGQENVPHDHWALLATAKILEHAKNRLDAELRELMISHTEQICLAMMQAQTPFLGDPVFGGSFDREGRTTPCATRLEGLLAALTYLPPEMTDLRSRIEQACRQGMEFLLRSQVSFGDARGGFPRSILGHPDFAPLVISKRDERWTEIRIDYVQHALSALLEYQQSIL